MKKLFLLTVMMATMIAKATAMTYSQARSEALFLTDKMAYELQLSNEQCEAVYEINIDYMLALDSRSNLYGWAWERRNDDLRYVLTAFQYDLYRELEYFYRPVYWRSSSWRFRIYKRYNERTVYYSAPMGYNSYRGGHNSYQTSYYAGRNFNKPTHVTPPTVTLPANNGTSNHGRNSTSGQTTSWRSGSTGQGNGQQGSGSSWRANSGGSSQQTRSGQTGTATQPKSGTGTQNTKTTKGGQFGGKR